MEKVYVIDGPKKGEAFALTKDSMTIGRSPDNDICITEIGVSRHHAALQKKDKKWYVTDTSSFQVEFVDGEQIERGQEVEINKKECNSKEVISPLSSEKPDPNLFSCQILPLTLYKFHKNK